MSDENNCKDRRKMVKLDENGKFMKGNPSGGRPPGRVNRFTAMRNDLVWAWEKGGGKQRLLEIIRDSSGPQFLKALSIIVSILPQKHIIEDDRQGPMIVLMGSDGQKVLDAEAKKTAIDIENAVICPEKEQKS